MKPKIVRGSCFDYMRTKEIRSYAGNGEVWSMQVGFRLVNDDAKQTIRGSSIVFNSPIAGESDGGEVTPGHLSRSVGFRLAKEEK